MAQGTLVVKYTRSCLNDTYSISTYLNPDVQKENLSITECFCAFPGGLCNLSMDRECRGQILQSEAIPLVTGCLSSRREETVLSAITTLMNLTTAASRSQTTDTAVLQCMLRFSISQSPRLRNLASVFLQDCCTEEQVARAEAQMQGHHPTALGIPLPKD